MSKEGQERTLYVVELPVYEKLDNGDLEWVYDEHFEFPDNLAGAKVKTIHFLNKDEDCGVRLYSVRQRWESFNDSEYPRVGDWFSDEDTIKYVVDCHAEDYEKELGFKCKT